MVINRTCNVATLMIENGRVGRAKIKKQAITLKRKRFSKMCSLKPLACGDLAGKFNLSHTHRTLW